MNGASSTDAIHVRAAPVRHQLRAQWVLQRLHSTACMQQPPWNRGTTPGCRSVAWTMVGHLAYRNRWSVAAPNHHPRPMRPVRDAVCWMHSAQLREALGVACGTAAHANDLSCVVWYPLQRVPLTWAVCNLVGPQPFCVNGEMMQEIPCSCSLVLLQPCGQYNDQSQFL
jgi:hypothetical protein